MDGQRSQQLFLYPLNPDRAFTIGQWVQNYCHLISSYLDWELNIDSKIIACFEHFEHSAVKQYWAFTIGLNLSSESKTTVIWYTHISTGSSTSIARSWCTLNIVQSSRIKIGSVRWNHLNFYSSLCMSSFKHSYSLWLFQIRQMERENACILTGNSTLTARPWRALDTQSSRWLFQIKQMEHENACISTGNSMSIARPWRASNVSPKFYCQMKTSQQDQHHLIPLTQAPRNC